VAGVQLKNVREPVREPRLGIRLGALGRSLVFAALVLQVAAFDAAQLGSASLPLPGMSIYDGKVIKLREMGFTDESASRDALHHSLGNVDKAIDRLTGADGVAQVKKEPSLVKRENVKSGGDGGGGGGGGGLASMFQRSQTSASPSQHVQTPSRQLAGGSSRPSAGTPLKRPHTSSASGGKGKAPAASQSSWLSRPSPPSGSGRAGGGSQEERGPEVVVEDSEDGGAGGRSRPPSQALGEAREGQHAPTEGRHSAGADCSVPSGSVLGVRGGPSGGRGGDGGGDAGAPVAKRRKVAAGAPLSERMRPEDFAGLVGQGEAAEMMRGMAESGALQSVILWGPPGSARDPRPETMIPTPQN
jgi:hypothetical protein